MLIKYILPLSISICSSTVIGDDPSGVLPPAPGEAGYNAVYEAMCAWGKTENMYSTVGDENRFHSITSTGVLVAENIVLVPSHAISVNYRPAPGSHVLDAVDENGNPINTDKMWHNYNEQDSVHTPRFTVRFRLNEDNSVGHINDGHESFYQVPVKRIVTSRKTDANQENPFPEDFALLILADVGQDPLETDGLWSNGWITHISPVKYRPTIYSSSAEFESTLASYGPRAGIGGTQGDNGHMGTLRTYDFDRVYQYHETINSSVAVTRFITDNPYNFIAGVSGSVLFVTSETGEFIAMHGYSGGIANISLTTRSPSYDLLFPTIEPVYGTPSLAPLSAFDVTGKPSPTDSLSYQKYNAGDWTIDINDVLAMSALLDNNTLDQSDWDQNGVVNIHDFEQYALELFNALNPYGPHKLFPLAVSGGDVNGDGRFNVLDKDRLEEIALDQSNSDLSFDFDGNSTIDSNDVTILNRVLTHTINNEPVFSHGIFGDANSDGVVNHLDYQILIGIDFDSDISVVDPIYSSELDWNVNHLLEYGDKIQLAAIFNPGDVSTGSLSREEIRSTLFFKGARTRPDFQLEPIDIAIYIIKLINDRIYDLPQTTHVQPVTNGIDFVDSNWRSPSDMVQHDHLYSLHDLWYVLHRIQDASDQSLASTMSSMLDFSFFDLNNDGRTNQLDVRTLESIFDDPQSGYLSEWDLNNDLVNDIQDLALFLDIAHKSSPIGQGVLADFNGDASPDCICDSRPAGIELSLCEDNPTEPACTDNDPIPTYSADCNDLYDMMCVDYDNDTTTTWIDDIFNSGTIFIDEHYKAQLDGDLDGDIDSDDQLIVLRAIQFADLNPDGEINFFDLSVFSNLFAAQDPSVDFNGDGEFNFFDVSIFTNSFNSPCGACTLPCCP